MFKGKSRLTNNLVALKEIRLEHEVRSCLITVASNSLLSPLTPAIIQEGVPFTAIREGNLLWQRARGLTLLSLFSVAVARLEA